jgi:hypothetical protein
MRLTLTVVPLLALMACSSLPKQMAGQFDARQDFLVVKSDGSLYWSPTGTRPDQLRFIGIVSRDSSDRARVHVVTPSTSQVWPKLEYSSDFSTVTVRWAEVVPGAAVGRSTEYVRSRPNYEQRPDR